MEQQSQQPISQSTPSTPVQPQPSSKNMPMLVGLGVVVLLIAVSGALWFLQNRNSANPQTEQSQNTTQQQQATPSQGLVKYGSIAKPAMKTIPQASYQATIRVLNVGTITDGQFKGKTLALALYEFDNFSFAGVQTYVYFISDSTGKPIAWDKNFFHDSGYDTSDCDDPSNYDRYKCGEAQIKELLGLTNNLQQNLVFLPKEFSLQRKIITANDHKSLFFVSGNLVAPDISPRSVSPVGQTETGGQIVRVNADSTSKTILPTISYYIVLPFGKMMEIFPEPDFANVDDAPQLKWMVGTKSVAHYDYGRHASNWNYCSNDISADQLQSTLMQTGITIKGDSIYEIEAQKYPKIYQCLHKKTQRRTHDNATHKTTYQDTVSYVNFISSHPMFFWKHPYGDLIVFVRDDVSRSGVIID